MIMCGLGRQSWKGGLACFDLLFLSKAEGLLPALGIFLLGSQLAVARSTCSKPSQIFQRKVTSFSWQTLRPIHAPFHKLALLGPWTSVGQAGGGEERFRWGGGDDPLANCICSCHIVANKHQIYMHFERSPFTIGFWSSAVARERRAGRARAGEKPGLFVL